MNINDYDHLVINYLFCPLEDVISAFSARVAEKPFPLDFKASQDVLVVERIYMSEPTPGGAHAKKVVLYEPIENVGRTAFLVNYADGWYTMAYALARELKCTTIQITSSRNDCIYPCNAIYLWDQGEEKRIVRSMLDGDRWEFFERGEIQNFENPEYYRRRRIASRFNRQILIEYMKKLGIDLESPDFFSSDKLATYFFEQRPE